MSHTTNPLSCLETLVGLRGACPADDPAAVYVDQLGVTELELRDYITASVPDVAAAFAEARRTAVQVIALRVQEKARRLYRPATLVDQVRAGYLTEVPTYEATLAGRLGGYVLEVDRPESYLELLIPSVGVQVDHTGTVAVLLIDLDQATVLDQITVDTVAGQYHEGHPHWRITAPRRRRRIMVAIDREPYPAIRATAGPARGGCSSCSGTTYRPWPGLSVRSGTVPTVGPWTYTQFQPTSVAAGLTVLASVTCDHEGWLCGWSRALALPLAYATCRELYDRALRATYAERLTARTADPERLKTIRDEFDALAAGALGTVVDGAVPPLDGTCFFCDRPLRTVTMLP